MSWEKNICKLNISVKISAPFLFPGVSAGRFGYDKVALRDWKGRLIIPQDQIRGIVLDGLRAIGQITLADTLFGKASDDAISHNGAGNFEPQRGKIFFADLVAGHFEKAKQKAHRVKIDGESGAAAEGHLLVIEQVAAPETEVAFQGDAYVFASENEQETIRAAIETALSVPLTMGALKSIGFGQIIEPPKVTIAAAPQWKPAETFAPSIRLRWTFKLDRPYLLHAQRIAENAYLGTRDISGAALKGLIANNVAELGLKTETWDEWFSQLRISMAWPDQIKPTAVSVVQNGSGGEKVNLALPNSTAPEPVLRDDWKSEVAADLLLDERVHTAIDPNTGAALDQKLFSTIAVAPQHPGQGPNGQERPYEFCAEITLPDQSIPSADVWQLIATHLFGLGRTGAILTTVKLEKIGEARPTVAAGHVAIRLLTDGLLADPFEEGDDAKAAFSAFWKQLLPHSNMIDCFIRTHFAGGYLARRFAPLGVYRPWMLTDAGSVFVFDLAASDEGSFLRLLAGGVCRPKLNGQSLNWQNCPFVAENGFGQFEIYTPQRGKVETW